MSHRSTRPEPRPEHRSRSDLPPLNSRQVPPTRREGKPTTQPGTARPKGNQESKGSRRGGGGGGGGSVGRDADPYSYAPTASDIDLNVRNTYNSILKAGIDHMRGPDQPLRNWTRDQIMRDSTRIKECYYAMEPYCGESFDQLVRLGYCSSPQAAKQAVRGCLPGASVASSHQSSTTASTRSGTANFSEQYRQTYTGNDAVVVYILKKEVNRPMSDYGEMLVDMTVRKMKGKKPPATPRGLNERDAARYILENCPEYVDACVAAYNASVAETDRRTDTQLGSRADYVSYR